MRFGEEGLAIFPAWNPSAVFDERGAMISFLKIAVIVDSTVF